MLGSLIWFLIGCLVLVVVLWVVHMVMGLIDLPPQVKQIALVVIGLVALIVLLILAVNTFQGAGGAPVLRW